jgi:oligopeptide transport system permease protein
MAEISKEKLRIIGCDKLNRELINRPRLTYWQDAWRRLKQNKVAMFSLVLLAALSIMTLIGPYLTPYTFSTIDGKARNLAPNAQHWFGTDSIGRDMFARVWIGGRVSILIGLVGAFIDIFIGLIYGGLAGFFGGKVDTVMMRVIEIIGSIPDMIVIILISLVLKPGIISLIIAITITGWIGTARMVRGQVLQIKQLEYVTAARALGAKPSRTIIKHILPNIMSIVIVVLTMEIPALIFEEAFLSFVGLGIQPPNTSWGALAADARTAFLFYPYQLFFPALFISLTMLCFNLLGDGLRDALDPRLRQ